MDLQRIGKISFVFEENIIVLLCYGFVSSLISCVFSYYQVPEPVALYVMASFVDHLCYFCVVLLSFMHVCLLMPYGHLLGMG